MLCPNSTVDPNFYICTLKRIKKDVDDTVTKFVYDGSDCVAEYDSNNSLQASYITPNLDQNLTIKRSGSTYYYHQDGINSVRNITDSSENIQNTYDYYAFGSAVGTPTENVTNDYKFTGRRLDNESGLYYHRTRYYNNKTGTFTQRDKYFVFIQLIMSRNKYRRLNERIRLLLPLYVYVSNNPVRWIDPFGLHEEFMDPPQPDYENDPMVQQFEAVSNAVRGAKRRVGHGISLGWAYFEKQEADLNVATALMLRDISRIPPPPPGLSAPYTGIPQADVWAIAYDAAAAAVSVAHQLEEYAEENIEKGRKQEKEACEYLCSSGPKWLAELAGCNCDEISDNGGCG